MTRWQHNLSKGRASRVVTIPPRSAQWRRIPAARIRRIQDLLFASNANRQTENPHPRPSGTDMKESKNEHDH